MSSLLGERFMTRSSIVLLAAAFLATISTSSEARHYQHNSCDFGPPHEYGRNNALSPLSYIYPAADWGPFYRCRYYMGTIVPLPDRY
jgi:hypothetical protein